MAQADGVQAQVAQSRHASRIVFAYLDGWLERRMIALFAIIAVMNSKHLKTLTAVFAKPTASGLEWVHIEALLIAAGCVMVEGRGSRVRFVHGSHVTSFHRPHPAKEAKPYQVEDARVFLALIGVKP